MISLKSAVPTLSGFFFCDVGFYSVMLVQEWEKSFTAIEDL